MSLYQIPKKSTTSLTTLKPKGSLQLLWPPSTVALTMVTGRSQDSLCEASEVHNEIWQMLLVTHYSFTARLAAQGAQCSGWKRRFKKLEDESSTACSDGFERLHSMAIARHSACHVHTIGDLTRFLYILTRFLYIFFYVPN